MLSRPEISYNYIDEEYKNKRFGSLENYTKYISENKAHILKMAVKGYDVKRLGDAVQYMCKDQYGNYYLFNTEKVFDYKVLLDIYTIEQETAINAYDGYSKRQKVAYNVNKWVQMVNNKDYEGTYNLLNETFRSNNWKSVQEFENFIKSNYPSYYEIEYGKYEENGESSVQTIILKDIEGIEENKTVTLIIKLEEGMKFEMSIATNDINIIKRLTNEIITNNHDIRIAKISNSNQETIDMLNNTNIDIMFLDLKMVENNLNVIVEKLNDNKKEKYKDSIIIMSETFNKIEDITRNCMVGGYILQEADIDEVIYK